MKRFLVVVVLVFLSSCKSKSVVVDATKSDTRMSANKII